MKYKQTFSNISFGGVLPLVLQPAPAWIAILGLVLISGLCLLIHAGGLLRLLFPLGSLSVGAFLYWRYSTLYLSFTWWLWFLSPLVSRLVSTQIGWTEEEQKLIIATPYLVTMLTSITFWRHLAKRYRQDSLPFVLAAAAVFYSLLVGLAHHFLDNKILYGDVPPTSMPYTVMKIIQSLLSWLSPIFFGFHLFVNWRDYPKYRCNIQRTFCWGILVMGIYGLLQYIFVPEWDRLWFYNSPQVQASIGWPEPFQLRVWSTSNTPGTFASCMMAGLLLLFSAQDPIRVPAALAGYLTFLLSEVRVAWGGWFVGLLALGASLKPHLQKRLVITVLVMGVCVYLLTSISPFSEAIGSRFQTFSNLSEDRSLNQRSELYAELVNKTLPEGIGVGLGGGKIVDAGILAILYTLGWFGTIPYMGGVILLLINLFRYPEARSDLFMNAARSISISVFIILPGTNTMVLLHGMLFWGFAGIAMAAHKYHRHQRTVKIGIP